MKYFIGLLIGIFFTGCTINKSYLEKQNNTIILNIQNEVVTLPTNGKHFVQSGGAVFKNVFFTNEEILVEYVKLKLSYDWTGLADGFYQDFLRKNIKGLEKVATYKAKRGDIYKFTVKGDYFYLISLYSGDSNLFLLDYNGKIVSRLLKKDLLIASQEQLDTKLSKRFLENYQFKDYFERKTNNQSSIIRPK